MAKVIIDTHSGFCTGVVKAIGKAENFLESEKDLYSLGDIVHNSMEVERLEKKGMQTITHEDLMKLRDVDVLFRAHGEPPSTYELAAERGIRLIDATCPVVINLQKRVRQVYEAHGDDGSQIVLFGKKGHAEVIGLMGQTHDTAIILEHPDEVDRLDFSKPIYLFSQTTKSLDDFNLLIQRISQRIQEGIPFVYKDTICRQVSNRLPHLKQFSAENDCILFVSGKKSSNGKALYDSCKAVNAHTFFISAPADVRTEMIRGAERIGICGATSTPLWLMEDVKKWVENLLAVK